jgi:hypothetical protein
MLEGGRERVWILSGQGSMGQLTSSRWVLTSLGASLKVSGYAKEKPDVGEV